MILQADDFNDSRIRTVVAAAITSDVALGHAPGNVVVRPRESSLEKESVVNVSRLVTIDKSALEKRAGLLTARTMAEVDDGVRLVLGL